MKLLRLSARPAAAKVRAAVQMPRAAVAAQLPWLYSRWRSVSSSAGRRPQLTTTTTATPKRLAEAPSAGAGHERPRAPTTPCDAGREAQALAASLHRLAKERKQPAHPELTRLESEIERLSAAMSPKSLSMTLWAHAKMRRPPPAAIQAR
jgi:hypothetical protein